MIVDLLRYTFKKYPIRIIFTALGILFSSLLYATSPIVLGYIIDDFDNNTVIYTIILYAVLNISASVIFAIRGWVFSKVEVYFACELSTMIFNYICHLQYQCHIDKTSGTLSKTIDKGYERILVFVKHAIFSILVAIIDVINIVIFTYFIYGILISTITLIFAILYSFVTLYLSSKRRKIFKELLKHENEISSFTTESLINNATIKYFNNEENATAKYKEIFTRYGNAHMKILSSLSTLDTIQSILFNIALVILLSTLCILKFPGSAMVVLSTCLLRIYSALFNLGFSFKETTQSIASIRNMISICNKYPHERISGYNIDNLKGNIEFKNVTFKYKSKIILNNISFKILHGQSVAFVGQSGAGKSTIINILFGFMENYTGSIYFDNYNARDLSLKTMRDTISIVPQNITLFNDTLIENVRYGNIQASDKEVIAAIHQAGIGYILDDNDNIGENGTKLSGGERQRVAIARIILRNSNIVVLDEATSALDNKLERQIQKIFKSVSSSKTSITIAHRLSTIIDSDMIFVMEKGNIVESGSHIELLSLQGKYYSLYHAQSSIA